MINADEDAFICDMAETYHIYDYKSLPVHTLATLAAGLRENSRIRMRISGTKAGEDTILLSLIHDRAMDIIKLLSGSQKEPQYLVDRYIDKASKTETGFKSPQEYEEARKKFVKEGE